MASERPSLGTIEPPIVSTFSFFPSICSKASVARKSRLRRRETLKIGQLRKDDFYLPILRTLEALGGSAANEEMEAKIIEEGSFSPADVEAIYPKSGQLILPDKIS